MEASLGAAPGGRCVIVFARAPEAGRVKTRLAAELGDDQALRVYRELGRRVLSQVRALGECELVVAFTPSDGAAAVRAWLDGADRYEPQSDGDLGARMAAAIATPFAEGARRVVVIGTDCPSIDAALVAEAFARLEGCDAVFAPAADGGYVLAGLAGPCPALFEGIPWSTPATLRVTLERARASGLTVSLLPECRDIDTASDWRDWQHTLAAQERGGASPRAR